MTKALFVARVAALAFFAFAQNAHAQADSLRDLKDSLAIASVLGQLRADSVTENEVKRTTAITALRAPIAFAPGSAEIASQAIDPLKTKAWLLYLNPRLRLTIIAIVDTARAETGLDLARSRIDAVRRYLASRAVDITHVGVEEVDGGGSGVDTLRFDSALPENSVLDVPPTSANPPAVNPSSMGLQDRDRRYRWGTVRVFYATDRARTASNAPDAIYSGVRDASGRLEFGRIEVTVRRLSRPGVGEQPQWYKVERSTDPNTQMTVRLVTPSSQRAIMDSLRVVSQSSARKEALVFIHGFNVSFHDAALRTAQLTYDLGFEGAPILYSWPSRASVFRYSADREAAEFTAEHLANFLDSVVSAVGAKHIHIIAHSMGNRALTLALERLALQGRDTLLSSVVMAAADVDAERFETQTSRQIRPLMQRMIIYMSSLDRALLASRLMSSNRRLGEATSPILVLPAAETIDASAFRLGDLLGHGYFAEAAALVDDLSDAINRRLAAPRPRLMTVIAPTGVTYWRIR